MGTLSIYTMNKFLNHVFNKTDMSPPVYVYLALCNSVPNASDTGATISEVGGTSVNASAINYARKLILFSAASSRKIIQNGDINFNQITSGKSWGNITGFALVDSSTWGAGNVLAFGSVSPNIYTISNQIISFVSTQIQVQIPVASTLGLSDYTVNKLLDRMFRNQAFTSPANLYLALFTAVINNTTQSFANEISNIVYVRKLVTFNPAISGFIASNSVVSFPIAIDVWPSIYSVGIIDSNVLGIGNILGFDSASNIPQGVAIGNFINFAIGNISMTFTY